MGILIEGRWFGGDDRQIGAQGWEPRQEKIRRKIEPSPTDRGLPAEAGRYHLIECPGCPLSHRVTMALRMKRLDGVISTARVRPVMGPNGREFDLGPGQAADPTIGARYLYEAYLATDPEYSGRASTPVLWDKTERRIVSNAYSEIFGMVNGAFEEFTDIGIDFRPAEHARDLSETMTFLGENLTGAVYRCGFARDQDVFDRYVGRIAKAVAELERRLGARRFLVGDSITEADLGLLACLLRFDAIYLPLFRCTSVRIADQPALCRYIDRLMALPEISQSFDLAASMTHYYRSHAHLNPTGIVPPAPPKGWSAAAESNTTLGRR